MARAALKWTLVELEVKTGVNKNTIVRFEAGLGVLHSTAIKLEDAFTKAGVSFVYEDENRAAGVFLSKELSRRIDEMTKPVVEGKEKKRRTKGK